MTDKNTKIHHHLNPLPSKEREKRYKTMKSRMGERGFTLIELLVTISIVAVISGALSMTVMTLMKLSPQSKDWNVALRQVQNAGYWISRDVQMSKGNITVGTGNPTFLNLTLPQTATDNKTIVYRLDSMPAGGLKKLIRYDQTANQQIMIAEYIDPNKTNAVPPVCDNTTKTCRLTVTIAAKSGNATVERTYEAKQRVSNE